MDFYQFKYVALVGGFVLYSTLMKTLENFLPKKIGYVMIAFGRCFNTCRFGDIFAKQLE